MTGRKIGGGSIFHSYLAKWIAVEHLERFSNSTITEISQAYAGIYSSRPTSWLALMARNGNVKRDEAIAMETDPGLVRIPGMRRSKFLLPHTLASKVFGATRLPLASHEWRLTEAGLTLDDYQRILPDLIEFTRCSPVQQKDIGYALGLVGSQIRACTTVATYQGVIIRTPPANPWSSRWLYVAAPDSLLSFEDKPSNREQLLREIACRYIEHYGPVTVGDLAWWLGVSKGNARLYIEGAGAYEIGAEMWISASKRDRFQQYISCADQHSGAEVRFLPAWDPLVMGYAPGSMQRDCLGLNQIGGYDSAGNGRPVVMIGARAVATWRTIAKGGNRSIWIDLSQVSDHEQKILKEAASVWTNRIGTLQYQEN
ncbi:MULTISPECIES: DNA glycosylase AlkZ-like family protein [unclassified Brenneria]|uniref:DNA glycosylase AlkZ-like family protein n=1 Tax=unclassified Brenneria TaxID=2634434 RepID=UPI0018F0AFA6|nr:crosslink repair DNA glycosylase YcaQ family protein [Brenneria sp. L3-3C-1]MBJ7223903.1 winged helix DNA-binding domain-containing protein [Brenneria sp. L3-3C-1]MEE3645148.1 crosslink repair DNA glycosylase YcaQ family protein [Brenneria sp. L3_3C_1]